MRKLPRVLVVEDDQPVREMACHLLRGAGYEVLAAGSAEEAGDLGRDVLRRHTWMRH